MKRNILLVAFLSAVMSVAFITEAWAAATLVTSKTEKQVGANTRYSYDVADTVETGTPEVFKIPVLKTAGKFDEISFSSTSPDVDIYISGLDAQTSTSTLTFLSITGINIGFSPEIKARDYVNLDIVQDKFLYLTITNNSATATGTWSLTIDFIRN
jgi:hypothetical protein